MLRSIFDTDRGWKGIERQVCGISNAAQNVRDSDLTERLRASTKSPVLLPSRYNSLERDGRRSNRAMENAVDELERWLTPRGLQQLAPVLRANDVDLEILPELTNADLEKLGLSLGQCRKLMKAVAAGVARSVPVDAPPSAREPTSIRVPERRHLTVMFCDLVGSTALASKLDPEDLREVIGVYHRCVAETVARFDGFVAKYLGDGVLVYFGYPQAHEDDGERAVRSGLEIVAAVGRLEPREGLALQARIGIATGLVVVGDLI